MIKKEYICHSLNGLSSRASTTLVSLANSFKSDIIIRHNEDFANLKSIMSTFTLVIKNNDKFILEITGEDENEAYARLNLALENLQIS